MKPEPKYPSRIKIGASLILWSLDALGEAFGIRPHEAEKLLSSVGMTTLIRLPGNPHRYVNLYAFESLLFRLSLPNALVGGSSKTQGSQNEDRKLVEQVHQELAGVLYGAITREVIRERVLETAGRMSRAARSYYDAKHRKAKKGS